MAYNSSAGNIGVKHQNLASKWRFYENCQIDSKLIRLSIIDHKILKTK